MEPSLNVTEPANKLANTILGKLFTGCLHCKE